MSIRRVSAFAEEETDRVVTAITLAVLVATVGVVLVFGDLVIGELVAIQTFLLQRLGIVWILCGGIAVAGVVLLAVGPWGTIVLGREPTPEFGDVNYFAMVFTLGLASGIVTFGPGEAVIYATEAVAAKPPGFGAELGTRAAAVWGMGLTLIHWGVPSYSTYAVITLPVAYYCFRKGAPFRFSSVLYPLVRERPAVRMTLDVLAVVAIVLGVALSTMQVTFNFLSGVGFQWDIVVSRFGIVIFGVAIALVFTVSAVTGIYRGILRLSWVTAAGFLVVGLATLLFGPTGDIVGMSLGAVAVQPRQYVVLAANAQAEWVGTWTIFNLLVWYAWAPAVGIFYARISRGRTIRNVVAYTVGANTLAAAFWFFVMGGAVLSGELSGTLEIAETITTGGFEVAAYPMLLSLPFGELFLFLFLGLGVGFMITSADSATLSVAMTASTTPGRLSAGNRWPWGVAMAGIITVLIFVGGNQGVRALVVVGGAIAAVIGTVAIVSMVREVVDSWPADAGPE